ncbi:MAG TPA: MFS transporter [Solirubrobacteraceae bacterium]|jgi:MFS family permease
MIPRDRRVIDALLPRPWPLRRMACGTLVSAVGNGAWFTTWAVFLTRSVGLSPAQVGVGMTIAAVLGALLTPVFGWLGDRAGARETFAAQLMAQGAVGLAFLAVHGMASFIVVAALSQIAASGTGGPRNALALGLSEPARKLEVLSRLRAISHIGWALGALLGGAVITVDARPVYVALLVLNAGTYFVYAALVRSGPGVPTPVGGGRRRRLRVVRDVPYMSLAGMTGTLALCWAMLSSGLPLWVALHTRAPQALSAVVVVVSSLGIAAFQTRVSRGVTMPVRAARAALGSGLALAGACLLLALTAGLGGLPAIALILSAAALHLTGELLFVASSWGLSVPLMPPDAPSEYQGAFATGESLALMLAPALMTTLVADWGRPGWVVLALIFLIPALAITPATKWALRTRPASPLA